MAAIAPYTDPQQQQQQVPQAVVVPDSASPNSYNNTSRNEASKGNNGSNENCCEMDCTEGCSGPCKCCASFWTCNKENKWYHVNGKGYGWMLLLFLGYIIVGALALACFPIIIIIGVCRYALKKEKNESQK